MLNIKQKNIKKARFPRFDKILVIQPIAEVYGEGNERQLCFTRLLQRWMVMIRSARECGRGYKIFLSLRPIRSSTLCLMYSDILLSRVLSKQNRYFFSLVFQR